MYAEDFVAMFIFIFVVVGTIATLIWFIDTTADVQSFDPVPGQDDCIVVTWENNRLSGEDTNRNGVFCRTELTKESQ